MNGRGTFFIRNPYLAMVIAVVVTLCGILVLPGMPAAQYPEVTPPQISVTAVCPGAGPETILKTVVEPLEREINGAPGLLYLDSTASDSGEAVLTATFAVGTDPETDLQNVQDRVNWATPRLPESVRMEGVTVREQSGSILLGISLYSKEGTYDSLFLANYAAIGLRDALERIPGAAQVRIFGGSDYAMRIWIDPGKCASLGLSVEEVVAALKSRNVEIEAGAAGAAPSKEKSTFSIVTKGRLVTPEEFGEIVVRASPEGALVKLREVASVRTGAESYASECIVDGHPGVMVVVYQSAGANGIAISDECRKIVEEKAKDFPPGLEYGFQYDSTNFVRAGIRSVVQTLVLAVFLVTLVTLVFLQDWRMALIPTLAIPVSILGTFVVLRFAGCSLNMITLFALTLAIGIVVDDAIIVIENVSRLMDSENLSPAEAAAKSMRQITGAIAATTAVLLAMFLPLCFFSGITGELYRQFGLTLSTAVAISAFNALTLSPALSGLLLRPREQAGRGRFARIFNGAFARTGEGVFLFLRLLMRRPWIPISLFLAASAGFFLWDSVRPQGFLPEEDNGYFFLATELPAGSSLRRTAAEAERISAAVGTLPGVECMIGISGYNVLSSAPSADAAFLIAVLKPWSERGSARLQADSILRETSGLLYMTFPQSITLAIPPPPIPGIGMAGGFNFVLEETGGGNNPELLAGELERMIGVLSGNSRLQSVFSAFSADTPVLRLRIDQEKARALGIRADAVASVLESMPGFTYVNDFNRFGQVYKVEIQAEEKARNDAKSILRLHVPNSSGKMVPLSSFATLSTETAAGFLTRHNLKLSAKIQGLPAPGTGSGEAMRTVEDTARKVLSPGFGWEWTDMSYQEAGAGDTAPKVFLLAVLFIFLFLSALYGSWLLPLSVLPAIPAALGGALVALQLTGRNSNLYTQIGIVLLFGMACKTAILLIDFAKQEHAEGKTPPAESAENAARLRFRAVMMTSLAFVFGTLPLAFAAGAGAESQKSIGIPVAGGMIGAVFGGLIVCPVFFTAVQKILDRRRAGKILPLILFAFLVFAGGCYSPPEKGKLIGITEYAGTTGKNDVSKLRGVTVLTRELALKIALDNNRDYLSAASAVSAARMRYYQALGAYSPNLSASTAVGQQLYKGSSEAPLNFPNEYNSGFSSTSVQANFILFNGLLREFEVLAAKENISMNSLLGENEKRILTRAVYLAYDEIIAAKARLGIASADAAFQQEELRRAEAELRAGDARESDVLNFQACLFRARSSEVQAENDCSSARSALILLMGYPESEFPGEIVFPDASPGITPDPLLIPDLGSCLESAVRNRPDLNAVRAGLRILEYRYRQGFSALSPVAGVFADYGYSSAFSGTLGGVTPGGPFWQKGNSFAYGGYAVWDLFSGFTTVNEIRARKADLDRAWLLGSEAWLKAVNEVRTSHSDGLYAAKLADLSVKYRDAMRKLRDVSKREYAVGEIDSIRLSSAQSDYVKSEYGAVSSEMLLRKALVRLYTAGALPLPEELR